MEAVERPIDYDGVDTEAIPLPVPDLWGTLARLEAKQDALYSEVHAVRVEFAQLMQGVMGAVTSNPLLRGLLKRMG